MKKKVKEYSILREHDFFCCEGLPLCFFWILILPLLFIFSFSNAALAGTEEELLWMPLVDEDRDFIEKHIKRETGGKNGESESEPGQIIEALMEADCGNIKAFPPYDERLLEAEMEDGRWNWGIKFDSGYRYSESNSFVNRHAGYVGMTWDILKSGLLQARSRVRENNLKLGLVRLQEGEEQGERMLYCREIRLAQFFSKLKAPLLKLKYDLLVVEYRALREAYFSGNILVDDLIRTEGRVKGAEEALEFQEELGQFEGGSGSFFQGMKEPPFLKVRLKPFMKAVKEGAVFSDYVKISEKILEEKSGTLTDNSLRFYIRSGVDSEDGETNYGTVVLGVRFSAPIGRSGRREDLVRLKRVKGEGSIRQQQRLLNSVRLVKGYEDKTEVAIGIDHKEFVAKEQLRRAWLLSDIRGGGSLAEVTRSLSNLTEARLKKLSVKESLYRKLLNLFTRSGTGYRDEFIEPVSSSHTVVRGRVGKRSIYLWSAAFNNYPNDFLIQVFGAKSISRVMLSYSLKSDQKKLSSFLLLARESAIEVELMAATNEWIFPEKVNGVSGFTENAFSMAEAVHLDIEPHTLDGYKKNEAEYKRLYLAMVKKIISSRGGKSVSVSIPLKWHGPLYKRLSSLVNRVYLMAYGVSDPAKLEKRLSPFLKSGKERVVIALRPKDFRSEWEMEKFIDEIFLRTGVREFAIHNFRDFLQMITRESL